MTRRGGRTAPETLHPGVRPALQKTHRKGRAMHGADVSLRCGAAVRSELSYCQKKPRRSPTHEMTRTGRLNDAARAPGSLGETLWMAPNRNGLKNTELERSYPCLLPRCLQSFRGQVKNNTCLVGGTDMDLGLCS